MLFQSSFEKIIHKSLQWLEIPYLRWSIIAILTLYILTDIPMIHDKVDMMFQYRIVQAITLLVIIYISHKDVALSSLLLIVMVISMIRGSTMEEYFDDVDVKQIDNVKSTDTHNDNFPPESSQLHMLSNAFDKSSGMVTDAHMNPQDNKYQNKKKETFYSGVEGASEWEESNEMGRGYEQKELFSTMEHFEQALVHSSEEEKKKNPAGEKNTAQNINAYDANTNVNSAAPISHTDTKISNKNGINMKKEMFENSTVMNGSILPGYNIPNDASLTCGKGVQRPAMNQGIATLNPQESAQSMNNCPTGFYENPVFAPY